ncbi:MAG: aryl carrier-like protein [Granulosicoccus sp.]
MLSELLGMDDVRSSDNFFEIGGDSITAIQFISRIRAAGLKLDIEAVVKGNSISEIAAQCIATTSSERSDVALDSKDSHPVSSEFMASGLDAEKIDDFFDSLQ